MILYGSGLGTIASMIASLQASKDRGEQAGRTERRDRVSVDNWTSLARRR
jgi:hypothetical protein